MEIKKFNRLSLKAFFALTAVNKSIVFSHKSLNKSQQLFKSMWSWPNTSILQAIDCQVRKYQVSKRPEKIAPEGRNAWSFCSTQKIDNYKKLETAKTWKVAETIKMNPIPRLCLNKYLNLKTIFWAVKAFLFGACFSLFVLLIDDIWNKYSSRITTTGISYSVR